MANSKFTNAFYFTSEEKANNFRNILIADKIIFQMQKILKGMYVDWIDDAYNYFVVAIVIEGGSKVTRINKLTQTKLF